MQLLLDQGDADDKFLTLQTLGALAKLHEIMELLRLNDPDDAANPTTDDLLLS